MQPKKEHPSLATLHQYLQAVPEEATLVGSREDYKALPALWQAQIQFFDATGSDFLYVYWESANLVTGPLYQPFLGTPLLYTSTWTNWKEKELSKWLYNRGIAFGQPVWALANFSPIVVQMTWKMVLKLGEQLFQGDDVAIFDSSLQWCLFYYHADTLFWGSNDRA